MTIKKDTRKEVKFQVRFSVSEFKALRKQAEALGLSASAYVRMLIRKQEQGIS